MSPSTSERDARDLAGLVCFAEPAAATMLAAGGLYLLLGRRGRAAGALDDHRAGPPRSLPESTR